VRPLHQDGCDTYVSLERQFYLQAHVISETFQSDSPPVIPGVGPVFADQHQHDVARGGCFLQYTAEVTT
jgi:hypothetical protein